MTSDLVASSSITHQSKNHRYDVFLSFRGDDTRDNFVSHLHKALSNHQITTFIDYNLTRGADFPPALFTAIEESLISIIIFSENYADSSWCLKELAKIMECKNSNEQIVLPVFYRVDPSHVRNQTGNFGAAFDRLQECSKGKMNFNKARSHLMEAANISGWDSHVTRPESQLIVGIVGDVLHKLNLVSFSYSTNLVGVFPHIEKVESLLCLDASDVSVVGIWGMGGIGKSTIARAVFDHICQKFDASHFVSNLQDELKRQSLDTVRESLLLKIFEKECRTMVTHNLRPDFIRRQLPKKKVFIVLDDVNDPIQLKILLEGHNYLFGSGSKILITSRDRQVLKTITDNKIHTMETMNEKDAMTLFSLNAFKQKYPTNSYKELSKRAIYYAAGNPLALVVLGSALFDRSKELWVSALEGLEKEPNIDHKNVLRSSYDTLSPDEKKIFLDVACFLFGCHQDFINQYYGNSGIFRIKTLEDKCLVTISSSRTIEMHDLLKELGRNIEQSEKHERLWNPEDVCCVLTKKTGAAKIVALSMDMWKIKEVHLDADAFDGIDSLQFLKFFNSEEYGKNNVHFNGCCVEYLPPELRYFQWDGFPSEHLPSTFVAENLIELLLDGSNIEELWREDKSQDILTNLQVISLRRCSNLIKIPDMAKAKGLRRIDLYGCKRYGNVPNVFVSKVLEYVDLSYCLNVTRFPKISSKSLKTLNLSGTNIEEVPSSIEYLSGLEDLFMINCKRLSSISTKICKLKSLTSFQFMNCKKLESFPEILEPMENLKEIWLQGCENLKSLPRNWYNMESLEKLDLSYCENLNSFFKQLRHGGNNWEMLPENMDQLANLKYLSVSNCKRLRSLPKLPSSLQTLEAECCESLESISIGVRGNKLSSLKLTNCFKLEEVTRNQILAHSHFMMTQLAADYNFCVLPGTEIPERMGMGVGSCMTIKFPSSHDTEYWSQFRGFGFCVVLPPISAPQSIFNFQCILKQNYHVICRLGTQSHFSKPVAEHLFTWRCIDDRVSKLNFIELMGKEVSFEFSIDIWPEVSPDVRKCGVQLLISASSSKMMYFPPELRYFQLDGSNIEELWRGDESQDILTNLQVISLRDCFNLVKIPNMAKAKSLRWIDLSGCKRCRNVPRFVSEVLEYVNLSYCSNVTKFPNISSKSIKWLDLSGTNIEEVPFSIEYLYGLELLCMNDCKRLSTISTNICKLKSLTSFQFRSCIKLDSFPEILEPMENLKEIWLNGCENLKSLPRNWYNMESLEVLDLSYCENLKILPSNSYLDELLAPVKIKSLHLESCHSLNISTVANAIPGFSFLKQLHLRCNNWEMLPENMDQLANLEYLLVSGCKHLRSVPKLPSSLQTLEAECCESLESISIGVRGNKLSSLKLTNCFKFQEVTRNQILAHSHFMMTQLAADYDFCVLPGTEIPEWMGKGVGSWVTIKFPSSHDIEYWSQFRGFGFCVVFSAITRHIPFFNFHCILIQNDQVICSLGNGLLKFEPVTEHLFIWRCIDDRVSELDLDELKGKEVSFRFSTRKDSFDGGWTDVRKCAVQVLFENTLPTSLISSATNTEDDQLLISASSSIPPPPEKPSKRRRLKCLPFLSFSK